MTSDCVNSYLTVSIFSQCVFFFLVVHHHLNFNKQNFQFSQLFSRQSNRSTVPIGNAWRHLIQSEREARVWCLTRVMASGWHISSVALISRDWVLSLPLLRGERTGGVATVIQCHSVGLLRLPLEQNVYPFHSPGLLSCCKKEVNQVAEVCGWQTVNCGWI